MVKPYTFVKKGCKDNEEIDLINLFVSVLKKWKILILLGAIGLIIGAPIGFMRGVIKVDDDMLSPVVKKQIDTFYFQELLNQKLNEEADESFISSLDSGKQYYSATFEYVIRTNEREDAALADSIFNIKNSNEYLDELSKITGYSKYKDTLSSCLSYSSKLSDPVTVALGDIKSEAQASLDITYTVKYLTLDQLNRFSKYLDAFIAKRSAECEPFYEGYRINVIHENVLEMNSGSISNAIQGIRNAQATRSAAATNSFKEYLVNLKKTDTTIKQEAIDNYELYWESLTNPEYEETLSKGTLAKWMLIVGVVFGFLGVCWFGVKALASPKLVNEDEIRNTYGLEILGYNPAGRKVRKGIDGALDRISDTLKPTDDAYIAEAVSGVLGVAEISDAVIICTDEERKMAEMLSAVGSKLSGKVFCGNIMTDAEILAAAKSAGGVFVLAEIDKTRTNTLEAELHTIEQYGLKMLGVIAI